MMQRIVHDTSRSTDAQKRKHGTRQGKRKLALLFLIIVLYYFTTKKEVVHTSGPYTLRRLHPFGVVVQNLILAETEGLLPADLVTALKEDIYAHRLLVFEGNTHLTPDRVFEIISSLGTPRVFDANIYNTKLHPAVVHITNEGNVGDTTSTTDQQRFHIDGFLSWPPTKFNVLHMAAVSPGAATLFIELDKLLQCVTEDKRQYWDTIYYHINSTLRPLVYQHPVTGNPTMMFHTMYNTHELVFIDPGDATKEERRIPPIDPENTALAKDLQRMIYDECAHLVYAHWWKAGDVVITDNLALAHAAAMGSHSLAVRDLWQAAVKGDPDKLPTKRRAYNSEGEDL